MKRKQKASKILSNAARWLVVSSIVLSLLSIKQVWAESTCLCEHPNGSDSVSDHCKQHRVADKQHSETGDAGMHYDMADKGTGMHHHMADMEDGDAAQVESEPIDSRTTAEGVSADGSGNTGSPADALYCCHILPAANTPPAPPSVHTTLATKDSLPGVELVRPARFVSAVIFHPPPDRPIYLSISSLLI